MHNENWDDFRFILAVVELGSLSAAARALKVNHATVLRRVKTFEDRYSVEIFERERSGYRVRANHSHLTKALQQMRTAMESVERAVLSPDDGMEGVVKITSTDSLCDAILPQIMGDLKHAYPKLRLELLSTNLRLNLGQLDAEITIRPAQDLPEDLSGTCVGGDGHARFCRAVIFGKNAGRA